MTATSADVAQPLMDVEAVAGILVVSTDYVHENARKLGGIFIARKWRWTPTGLAEALDAMRDPISRPQPAAGLALVESMPSAGGRRRRPAAP